jgi:hypothetical protein
MFFTFLAIGFANGSIAYLDKKMNDAFVNWLTINVPFSRGGSTKIEELKLELNKQENRSKYGYRLVTSYLESLSRVYDEKTGTWVKVKGRSVDFEADGQLLKDDILKKENLVAGDAAGFTGSKDLALIVTEKLLQDLHYPKDASHIYLLDSYRDTLTNKDSIVKVPVPIRNIVKEIPGKNQLAFTLYFHNAYNQRQDINSFDLRKKLYLNLFFAGDAESAKALQKEISAFFQAHREYDAYRPSVNPPVESKESLKKGYSLMVDFFPVPESYGVINSMYTQLSAEPAIKKYSGSLVRTYDYSDVNESFVQSNFDWLSIYFEKLDNVRSFSDFIFNFANSESDKGGGDVIQVDTAKVKEKENFLFLSKVTTIISYLLVLFGAISVSLFLYNLLRNHLQKVKMNIGTFKAIGMKNNESRNIYFMIIISFLSVSMLLGLLSAGLVGFILNKIFATSMAVEKGISYFSISQANTMYTIIILLLTAVIVSWLTIQRILSKSPGDLIYNR